jgi:hypothetical protein
MINSVYSIPSTEGKIKFLHAAAGYPVEDTWTKAIDAGNYLTWPGLNTKAVRCHFPKSDETQKGHMKKQRQNVRSTRIKIKESKGQAPPTKHTKMQDVYIKVHNLTNTMHSNQTGCFPALSRSGNQYIIVLVEVDGNYINAKPMKNRSAGSMIKAYLILWNQLTETGSVKPKMHILNNKVTAQLKAAIKKNCAIQLVPLDNHRRNLAERAIQTFKNHFKAIIQGMDDSFPMNMWDKLLPQTILTLNLMRQSNTVPTISVYQYVRGLATCTTRMRRPNARSTNQESNLGGKCSRRMVHPNVPRALPLPHNLCKANKKYKNIRHGLVQTQIHNATYRNTGRHDS